MRGDKFEELEATVARLQQERDRLKNEALRTSHTTEFSPRRAAPQHDKPDLVIGVDFRTTQTRGSTSNEFLLSMLTILTISIGVAWTNLRSEITGQKGSFSAGVPSKLQDGPNEEVKRWGFLCDDEETVGRIREGFKPYLDQNAIEVERRNDTSDVPENTREAVLLAIDYLQ
jgi:hypothetical protein